MKLDCVLTSCNLNKEYTKFISFFVKSWKYLIPNINIKIILIADEIPKDIIKFEKYIILFPPIENIYSSFIAQYIRILYPALLEFENGVLISDIDMIPMNKKYYINSIKKIKNNCFITYRDTRLQINQLNICYNIATPKIWSEVFNIKNINDIKVHLKKVYNKNKYENKRLGVGWYIDQINIYNFVKKWDEKTKKHRILKDIDTKFIRLDRKKEIIIDDEFIKKIQNGYYCDYHCFTPFDDYYDLNYKILNILRKKKFD